jgi:hypothetical protein
MSTQNLNTSESKTKYINGSLVAGLILTGIGLGLLIFQFAGLAMYFPLVLGLVFLTAGIATRQAGFLIPGGIIGGVGLGTLVTMSGRFFPTDSVESGGVFLLTFSLGWFLITLLSKLFTNETQTWALIPGAVMATIGGLILMGEKGLLILEFASKFWPVILVVIGLSILYGWWKENK